MKLPLSKADCEAKEDMGIQQESISSKSHQMDVQPYLQKHKTEGNPQLSTWRQALFQWAIVSYNFIPNFKNF